MYYRIGASVPSLHRESADSLIDLYMHTQSENVVRNHGPCAKALIICCREQTSVEQTPCMNIVTTIYMFIVFCVGGSKAPPVLY